MNHVKWHSFRVRFHIFENMFGVQKFRVNFVRGKESLTNHKDLSGLISGGLWFCGVHVFEQLLENPQQSVVVFGSEYLSHKPTTFPQKFCGQLHGV